MAQKVIKLTGVILLFCFLVVSKAYAATMPGTKRLAGDNRYSTAVEISKEGWITSDSVILATGEDFPDALSIAPIAAKDEMPIILTEKQAVPDVVSAYLKGKTISKSYIIGGTSAISDFVKAQFPNYHRISGNSRYETNIAILDAFKDELDFTTSFLATGVDFPDALAGSSLAPAASSPIILTDKVPAEATKDYVKGKLSSINILKILGGIGPVPVTAVNSLGIDTAVRVHYIDVGQADSILIQQGGKNMLIDAGNTADSGTVVNYLKAQGVKKIDVLVATHPHEDHIGGMAAVINTFDIGKIYMTDAKSTTKAYEDMITAIRNKALTVTLPVAGNTFNLGSAAFTILAPNSSNYDETNDYSIVLKMVNGGNKFLFTGDAESISEGEMLNKGYDLSADVLKVGHHGSSTSTTQAFLDTVNTKSAVISVGAGNDYGHPTQATLNKLRNKGISIYRTDLSGTIVATSDGSSITFNTSSNPGTGDGSQNSSNVTASVDNLNPAQYSTVHLTVTGPAGGEVTSICHYKSTTTAYSGIIGADNKADIAIPIGKATLGYTVYIDITVTYQGHETAIRAFFTPK